MKLFANYLPERLKNTIKSIINYSPTKELEICRIKLINASSKTDLLSQDYVEKLLCELGLNNEELFNYPKTLFSYCGNGLLSWQYPIQFSKYLLELANRKVSSYLEIGVKHGGTFIVTVEYLSKYNTINKAIGVDLFPAKGLIAYKKINKIVRWYAMNSRAEKFRIMLQKQGPFDLVLIDGDHSYEGCLSDFLTIKEYTKMIAFHDIVGMGEPGVMKVWNEIKSQYDTDFEFIEFIEQYNEVFENTDKTWLGLGLAIKKNNKWI